MNIREYINELEAIAKVEGDEIGVYVQKYGKCVAAPTPRIAHFTILVRSQKYNRFWSECLYDAATNKGTKVVRI